MGNPDAKNRCDREMPDCRPKGIGQDCWTPKQLAKYGIDPADVAPEKCAQRVYADFLYNWNDCMSGCYTSRYGTQPIDDNEQRQLENKNKKKSKSDKDTDGDGVPDGLDEDRDGDGIPNNSDTSPDGDAAADAEQDKEAEDFPDTDPSTDNPRKRPKRGDSRQYDSSTTSWRVVTLCKNYCAGIVRLDYSACFCDQVKCGPDDDETGGKWTRPTYPAPDDPDTRPDVPDDVDKTSFNKNKLNVTDSRYGAPIEIVYGHHVVAGNIVWIAPTRREQQISIRSLLFGASTTASSGTVITSPVVDFALGMCTGVMGAVTRIYFNDQLFYDANTRYAKIGIFNAGDRHEIIKDKVFFYDGDEAQRFPSQMEQPDEYPIGYRGLSMLVFKGLDLRAVGNKFPSIRVELAQEVIDTPVSSTTTLTMSPVDVRAHTYNKIIVDEGNAGGYKVVTTEGTVLYDVVGQSFDANTVTPISDTYIATNRGGVVESRLLRSGTVLSTYASPLSDLTVYGEKGFPARGRGSNGSIASYFVIYEAPNVHFHPVTFGVGLNGARTSVDIGHGVYGGAFISYYDTATLSATEAAAFVKFDGKLKLVEFVMASTDGARGFVFNPARPPITTELQGAESMTAFVASSISADNTSGSLVILGRIGPTFAAMAVSVAERRLLWAKVYSFAAPSLPVWNFAVGGLAGSFSVTNASTTYVIDTRDGAIIMQHAALVTAPWRMNMSGGSVILGLDNNSFTAVNAQGVSPVPAVVSDIVYDIGLRAKMSAADMIVRDDTAIVGYKVDTNSPAKSFLDELTTVTGVVIFDEGGRLATATADSAPIIVPADDFGSLRDNTRVEHKVRDDAIRPAAQRVQFYDALNGLAQASVVVKPDYEPDARTGDAAVFETNVVLTPNDALALAEYLASRIQLADVTGQMALGPKYLALTPGDVIASPLTLLMGASQSLRVVTIGADKAIVLNTKQHTKVNIPTLPDVDPIIVTPVDGTVDAGTPIIIQAKPVTFEDTQSDESSVVFYAGVIGNVGETTMNMFLDGAYVARQSVTKPLAAGVVTSTSNLASDVFGPQWETNDQLTVVFDSPPDTSIWYNAVDINNVTASDMTANLLLVGREWMQFRAYEVALDGITVTFRDIFRGLRGSDAYQGDVMAGRLVYAYDTASWGKFLISKTSATLGPATIVSRSLSNESATPEIAQSFISMEGSYHWPIRRVRLTRDMLSNWMTVQWDKRSRYNGPLDDAYLFEVPGLTTGSEIFIVKEDFDLVRFTDAVTSIYSDVFEWNATSYVRLYQMLADDQFVMTPGGLAVGGIDYLTDKFHIVVRTANNTINPSASGHYLVATYDPAINTDYLTGAIVEPATYTLATIP